MNKDLKCISPVDGSVYAARPHATEDDIAQMLTVAKAAQTHWQQTNMDERAKRCGAVVDALLEKSDVIAEEIAWQMGRPIRYGAGEVAGFEARARYMISIAEQKLVDVLPEQQSGFHRYIQRAPHGVVLSITPWNYPYLTAVNSIIPAIMAGNAVIMKGSAQTPLVAERIAEAMSAAGMPAGVFQIVHAGHEATAKLIQSNQIDFVSFTGSTRGGEAIERAAVGQFLDLGLELGGKDPAYVCADVDMDYAVENLVDGAYFNSGQSCCGVERIYVDQRIYDEFVEKFVALVSQYKLGNPLDEETTLGPMVRPAAAQFVVEQINDAVAAGAKAWIDQDSFAGHVSGTAYLAPQVLSNVDHNMRIMTEESFGPVVGIMSVSSHEQAVQLMNDSDFGLTASIWTRDQALAIQLGEQLQTGTVFMNRCDYLDPGLAWTGTKQSGKGCSLSELGYERLTRAKSFHLKQHP